jgi:Protein of unknown function (DUF2911)
MRKAIVSLALVAAGLLSVGIVVHAQQDKAKRPSPPASTSIDLGGGATITIDYSSPRAKGRKIYGGVVPFGEIWRTGANEATTFVTTKDVMIGTLMVPAGNYTLFTVPAKDKWALVLSKKTGEWGTDYPGPSNDLGRTDMKVTSLSAPVENFTITLEKAGSGANLNLDWETTRASVPIAKK